MADSQSTQTHPKFIWHLLVLGISSNRIIQIIRIVAATRHEVWEKSPAGCVMVFAGRLPIQEMRYVR
ncbi:host cell division inhibitor Icd-like protein [Pectobacterium versatile]|uniref:host cell division inhibitor Icd-like protein n=1 Tax=Pectobacterium versatile TaxID=2488639 RepID=UPI001F202E7F|nr:host cell division inhibitor Icd-like protein [Pectobacterium versatile]